MANGDLANDTTLLASDWKKSHSSVVPLAAQINHPLIFDLRTVEDQDGSMRDIGSIWNEELLRLEVGGMSLATTGS